MRPNVGPFTQPGWRKRLAVNTLPPFQSTYSGEIVVDVNDFALGAARYAGEVTGIWMSVQASGKDDTNDLYVEGEVYINGTTCLTTKPKIAHVSGETSQAKTTIGGSDAGTVEAVIDTTANTFAPGDVLSADFLLERTASPTTEMKNPVIVVELEPIK